MPARTLIHRAYRRVVLSTVPRSGRSRSFFNPNHIVMCGYWRHVPAMYCHGAGWRPIIARVTSGSTKMTLFSELRRPARRASFQCRRGTGGADYRGRQLIFLGLHHAVPAALYDEYRISVFPHRTSDGGNFY